jgi:two-component system cell cycle sensor histidine kinase/response regulator CckA
LVPSTATAVVAVSTVVAFVVIYVWARRNLRGRTARRIHEHELAIARLARIVETCEQPIFSTSLDGTVLTWNHAAEVLFGYSPSEIVSQPDAVLVPVALQDAHRLLLARIARGERVEEYEVQRLCKNGAVIDVTVSASPILDQYQLPTGASFIARDVTTLKRLQDQLRQAQKMEAVGLLAGGIAHDFNNMLTAIHGYAQLAMERFQASDPVQLELREIVAASERAAALTRQLLAFSRKQVLQPRVLEPNELLRELEKLLHRLIGEHIELQTQFALDVGSVRADPGQLEQVIVNLAVNARDAMPTGGRLLIETANVELHESYTKSHPEVTPGLYVMIAVSDTGTGMDRETAQRIFEPFFTTKEVGKGTGLGLSTAYGVMRQSGGHILVYSEKGQGTSVKLYLPRVFAIPETMPAALRDPDIHGTETVLVVEDDDAVRSLCRRTLERSGYHVLQAESGEQAIVLCSAHAGPIHVVLTDVIMSRMTGRDLADALAERRPEARVVFMSGYTTDAVLRHGVIADRTNYLEKPFTPAALLWKVRDVLDKTRAA